MQVNLQLSQLKRPRKKDTINKHYTPYMVKKTIYPGTRGMKNKVLLTWQASIKYQLWANVRWVKVRLAFHIHIFYSLNDWAKHFISLPKQNFKILFCPIFWRRMLAGSWIWIQRWNILSRLFTVRKAAKKVLFLGTGQLRGGVGLIGCATKEKRTFFLI